MTSTVNKEVNGIGPEWHRVIITHLGTTATITEDLGGVVASASHGTTGAFAILWNQSITGDTYVPAISGYTCGSNVVAHTTVPLVAGMTVVQKLVSTGGNYTSGRVEFSVKRIG